MRWVVLAVLAACYSPTPQPGAPCSAAATCPSGLDCVGNVCVVPGDSPDASVVDAARDDALATDGCTSYASQLDTCALPDAGPLVLSGNYAYNTDTHELRHLATNTLVPVTTRLVEGAAGPIDVILASRFELAQASVMRATGSRPFGIVAEKIELDGRLDVGSGGAGARTGDACGAAAGASTTTTHPEGPGGGGGGAFHGSGGRGGDGDTNLAPQPGSDGGLAVALPAGPLGGCPGGDGGTGLAMGGAGGLGGGAVYLVARNLVRIGGGIQAGGGGGLGGQTLAGSGGGGGAGGMIWIEGGAAMISSVLAANGGGGGGGADDDGNDGAPGARGLLAGGDAQGGLGGGIGGGDGGNGSQINLLPGQPGAGASTNAGGGGGGGAGFVVVRTATVSGNGVISPPRSP